MSQDYQAIAKISYITDCDTELYKLGDVVGTFDDLLLETYLKKHGETGLQELLCHLALMNHQAIEMWRKVRSSNDDIAMAGATSCA